MQGLVWLLYLHKSFFFYYPALLTVHSFLTDDFIYFALKDSKITDLIDIAIDRSSFIYVCMVMLLSGGNLQELCRQLTDVDYMPTNVFVKLTLFSS